MIVYLLTASLIQIILSIGFVILLVWGLAALENKQENNNKNI
jgi:hypothetical protein